MLNATETGISFGLMGHLGSYADLTLPFTIKVCVLIKYCVIKLITMCSPMTGQFFETMIGASSDEEWL